VHQGDSTDTRGNLGDGGLHPKDDVLCNSGKCLWGEVSLVLHREHGFYRIARQQLIM
jgi:hypothetical protein